MNILHVSQGLPPFRTGGLNRYCLDLMQQQVKDGHAVSLLCPGEFLPGRTRIKKGRHALFDLYTVVNPLPLALVFGINSPERYGAPCASDCYRDFLKGHVFDVIHIHCIMGIHLEFFQAAAALHIPMVMTTHDYYPFCIRNNLIDRDGRLCTSPGAEKCRLCNAGLGLSKKAEILMQSDLYRRLKYSRPVTAIRAVTRKRVESIPPDPAQGATVGEYGELLRYYGRILRLVDLFHCNSDISARVYQTYLPGAHYKVIPITNANISLAPSLHGRQGHSALRIGFMGGPRVEKGLPVLLEALTLLDARGAANWKLNLYGGDYGAVPQDARIHCRGKYSPDCLKAVFENLDIVAMPSICLETFGLTAAEALSFGLPVITSDRVGAQTLVAGCRPSLVCRAGSALSLADTLHPLFDERIYNEAARWVYDSRPVAAMPEHAGQIAAMYHTVMAVAGGKLFEISSEDGSRICRQTADEN